MPEDPAAVAARLKKKEELEFQGALIGLGVLGVAGVGAVVHFVREAKEATAASRRPRQPWDI